MGLRTGSDLHITVTSRQGCVCWGSGWVHWGHTGEAEPMGMAAGRLGIIIIIIYFTAGSIFPVQTHRDGAQGCAMGM